MRCRNCDYALWNLASRECPECGTPFRPSEFEFRPNSVRFCCPHCDQAYYGTAPNGFLVPMQFECVSCHRPVRMDEMVVRPVAGVDEAQTMLERMPWLDRGSGQRVRKWFGTVGRSMVAPNRLMAAVPRDSGLGEAWWYALLTVFLILLCGYSLPMTALGVAVLASGDSDGMGMLISAVAFPITGSCLYALLILVWGLVAHAVIHLTGGAPYSLGRTYQALCYSAGANITTAFPCLGVYPFIFVGLVWWLVSGILMVGEAQQVRGGRAALAVLVLPLLVAVTALLGFVGLMFWGVNQAQVAVQQAVVAQQTGDVQMLTAALIDYAADHEGRGPDHAIGLASMPSVGAMTFVRTTSMTPWQSIDVAGTPLGDVPDLPPNELDALAARAASRLPDQVVAHRVGAFVFVYHGIDLHNDDEGLWLVVQPPAPSGEFGSDRYAVGFLDGTVETIDSADFPAALVAQNELRTRAGLGALPPPAEVDAAVAVPE